MIKTYLFTFLTFFLFLNSQRNVFAQYVYNFERKTSLYSDTLHASHYGVHLTNINLTNKTIKGYTEAVLVSKISSLSSITLELAKLKVDSVFIDSRKTSAFSHNGNQIKIYLTPVALSKGDSVEVVIYYHGSTFVDPSGWGGFHFSGDYALNLGVGFDAIPHNLGKAWFPCIDDFRDRALYDVYLTVTNDKKAVSGGTLVDITDNGNNTSTWHWKTSRSLPTYLISATTGIYELITDTYSGIVTQIPITYFCRPSDTNKIAGTFSNLKGILRIFENHFGPYPFERVGFTGTPGRLGAMEHAGNISYPFSGWTGNTQREGWYAHELSHMWFGNMVTCSSAEDMWLNEGWAVWAESLFREGIYGKQAYRDNMRSKLKEVLLSAADADGGYYPVSGIPQSITYGKTVYDKGGQVVHTLRGYLGDSLFFGGIKAYLKKYAYNYASSYDLRDFLSAYSGIDLVPFFDAWVFAPGFLHFSIDSVVTVASGNEYKVSVYVRQKLKGTASYANANHLEISFMDSNWQKITDSIVFSGVTGHKTFLLPFKPVATMVDPDEKISDATTDVAKTLKSTGEFEYPNTYFSALVEQIADPAFLRVTHNWVAADSSALPRPGIRVSASRYWTVEGIFPAGFKAKGKFVYTTETGLDNTLITSPEDSLVLYYRPGAGHPWKRTAYTASGTWTEGTITVETLQKGEYVLAVMNHSFSGPDSHTIETR